MVIKRVVREVSIAKHLHAKPSRKEISLFYKPTRSQFLAPERIHALHIVKNLDGTTDSADARCVLERALGQLIAGAEFAGGAGGGAGGAGGGGGRGGGARGGM